MLNNNKKPKCLHLHCLGGKSSQTVVQIPIFPVWPNACISQKLHKQMLHLSAIEFGFFPSEINCEISLL